MNLSTTQLRQLGSVMYFAAVALIINFFAEFTIKVWPLKFGELNWRAGAIGLVMDVFLATIVPMTLMYVAAIMNNHRKLLNVLRILSLVLGVLTIALLLMFALDSIQVRTQLPQNVKMQFYKVAMRAAMVGTLFATASVWTFVAIGNVLKSQGTVRGNDLASAAEKEGMLMVGTREAPRRTLRSIDGAATEVKTDAKKEASATLSIDM
jgi:uncharacterized membrane protein